MLEIGKNPMEPAPELKCHNLTEHELISIQCFPQALSAESKFGYTLFFLLVPWPFFIYEFFTSRQYQIFVNKGDQIVLETGLFRRQGRASSYTPLRNGNGSSLKRL